MIDINIINEIINNICIKKYNIKNPTKNIKIIDEEYNKEISILITFDFYPIRSSMNRFLMMDFFFEEIKQYLKGYKNIDKGYSYNQYTDILELEIFFERS